MTSSKTTLVTPKSGSTWLAMNRQTRPPACTANPCPVPTCCTLCWQRRPKQRVHFVCAARSRQADHDHAQHALPDHVQRPEYFSTPRSNPSNAYTSCVLRALVRLIMIMRNMHFQIKYSAPNTSAHPVRTFLLGGGGAGMTSSKPTLVTPKSGSTWQAMNRQKRVGEMLSQLPNAAKRHTLPSSSSS